MTDVATNAPLTADELAAMIAETYELWAEVLTERAQEARRSGTSGGLL